MKISSSCSYSHLQLHISLATRIGMIHHSVICPQEKEKVEIVFAASFMSKALDTAEIYTNVN